MLHQEIGWFDLRSNSTGALTTRLAVDASEVKGVRRKEREAKEGWHTHYREAGKRRVHSSLKCWLLHVVYVVAGVEFIGSCDHCKCVVIEHSFLTHTQATGLRLGIILQTVFGFITAVVIAFTASWELSLVMIFCFPVLGAFGFLQFRLLAGRTAKNKKKLEESGKTAVESIDNVRTVVSLGVEETFITRYKNLLQYPFE